jgi:hypothetical protein
LSDRKKKAKTNKTTKSKKSTINFGNSEFELRNIILTYWDDLYKYERF